MDETWFIIGLTVGMLIGIWATVMFAWLFVKRHEKEDG
jgi:hypothetical protein